MVHPLDKFTAAFMEHYDDNVKRWSKRTHTPAHLVEEAVQETFLALHKYKSSYDPSKGKVAGWFTTTLANMIRRGNKQERKHKSSMELSIPKLEEIADSDTFSTIHPIEQRILIADVEKTIRNILQDPFISELVMGNLLWGFTIRELSEAGDVEYEALAKRISRVRETLRGYYGTSRNI